MKQIRFTQQKPLKYIPLRIGLGQIEEERLEYINFNREKKLCPKIYTSRTRPLKGEYVVIEGDRYHPKPVLPRIEFRVAHTTLQLDLLLEKIYIPPKKGEYSEDNPTEVDLSREGLTFPELDLGIKDSTFKDLKNELLKLNPRTTIDTSFYVNRLEKK